MVSLELALRFLKIARRFNAGSAICNPMSPGGRKEARQDPNSDVVSTSNPASKRRAIFDLNWGMSMFLVEEFHDIVPPVNYSLIPAWAIFATAFVALTVLGLVIWLVARRRKTSAPLKSPRESALEALQRIEDQINSLNPYRFSIRVSDILRRYVTEQYDLPVTRQTSVEFLERLRKESPFSEDERALLEDFLNRCDLIKFARYEATTVDSRMLLEEATRFVQGGQLATA
jgi:hypothetical protein